MIFDEAIDELKLSVVKSAEFCIRYIYKYTDYTSNFILVFSS
jgi:hypothetical protein